MKTKDLQIIQHLRENARMPLTTMSKRTGIPVSTIFKRLKEQEKKYINKHTTLLDFSKLGYNTLAMIKLKVERTEKEAVGSHLKAHPQVNTAYKINNGYDFLVQGVFKDIREVEEFIESLSRKYQIKAEETFYIIDDIKREGFLCEIGTYL